MLVAALGVLLAAGQASGAAPPDEGVDVDSVTVTAARPAPTVARTPPLDPEPITFFRDYCFEPNRLHGRSARPVGDPRWRPLDAESRRRLAMVPSTLAYLREDPAQKATLLLRIEERESPFILRRGLAEHRCSLVVSGGTGHDAFSRGLAALFGGSGTDKHVGHQAAPGYEPVPGWRQWMWSMIPPLGHSKWQVFRAGRSPKPSFVAVTDASYFNRHAYVAGELKQNGDATRPVSILMLTHTFRPEPGRGFAAAARRDPARR